MSGSPCSCGQRLFRARWTMLLALIRQYPLRLRVAMCTTSGEVPLLTPRQVAPAGSPQVRTRCFPAPPPHLPPRLTRRLRCVVPARRITSAFICGSYPSVRRFPLAFLPPNRLPCRSWLRVIDCSCSHDRFSYIRTCTSFTTRQCWAHTSGWSGPACDWLITAGRRVRPAAQPRVVSPVSINVIASRHAVRGFAGGVG
jgi:hypothetical protein